MGVVNCSLCFSVTRLSCCRSCVKGEAVMGTEKLKIAQFYCKITFFC